MKKTVPLLIEVQDLQAYAEDENTRIIDLCCEQSWQSGHIPKAMHVPPQTLVLGHPPAPGLLPSVAQLEKVFAQLGLTPDAHFFVYDDEGGGWAGRFIWTLDVIGHKRYSYINGGLQAWRDAGLDLEKLGEQSGHPVAPTQPKININQSLIVHAQEILQRLGSRGFRVWDARSPEEYSGKKVYSARGGHIPGAINCEWTNLMDPDNASRIRTDIVEYLNAQGIHKDQEIITHCQTHHRSGLTWLAGKILGFNIRAYPGSWSEWGNLSETPVEKL